MNNTDQAIQDKLRTYPQELFAPYLQNLLAILPGPCAYIVGYGSCLSQTTQSSTSVPDFYVVVEDYQTFYKGWKGAFLNKHLPPNIYHFDHGGDIVKYCVISKQDLHKQVQADAPDVYHIGRFSKRIALIHQDDDNAMQHLLEVHKTAAQTAFTLSHQLTGPSENLDQAIEKALALSYVGDVRIEADNKVQKIYAAEKDYYQTIYGECFTHSAAVETNPSLSFWIRKSRMRARMRWIKNILTASSWIDYMLFKIERTKGIKIELTKRQKTFWFISIWPILWRLQKDKLIK